MSAIVSHIENKRLYINIWIILLCFTALTTGVAYIDLGVFNTVAALAIAVCKASLVVLFFMHVRHSERLVRLVVCFAVFWLLILIVISLSDFATRHLIATPHWL
ncbi:MAG: cytochrome C oxidase subunit IV family protein [Terriglobia bacterium]